MNSTLKTTLLFSLLTGLCIAVGQLLGGQSGAGIAFIIALIINIGSYWFSDKIVLKLYGGKETTKESHPHLHQMMKRLCKNAGLPLPKIYIIHTETPNAFATGRNPEHSAVAFSEGLLRGLSDDEIAAVAAHELAHIKNRDTLISAVVASIAGAISMLANIAQWAFIFGRSNEEENRNPIVAMITIMLAPLIAMLIQMAISRSREFEADKTGAEIHGNPLDLANALARLHNLQPIHALPPAQEAGSHMFIISPFRGAKALSLFSTHPPVEERIEKLNKMVI